MAIYRRLAARMKPTPTANAAKMIAYIVYDKISKQNT